MIFKYTEFLAENYDAKPSSSSFFVLVAVAIFKPEIFAFLSKVANRYTMSASEVNQLVLLEVRNHKNIMFRAVSDSPKLIVSDLEASWSMIKKANESAQQIRVAFPDITAVYVSGTELEVETGDSINSIRRKQTSRPVNKIIASALQFDEQEIYRAEAWENFVSKWAEMLRENLVAEASVYVDKITNHKAPTWSTYMSRRKDTLGVKVSALPRLYYNNLMDLSKDIVHQPDMFTDYEHFMNGWLTVKRSVFVNELMVPALKTKLLQAQQNGVLSKLFSDVIAELNGVSSNTYFTLNNKGSLVKIEPTDTDTKQEDITYKLLTNKKSEVIITLTDTVKTVKILVGTSLLAPSHLKISVKQNG